jgi:hypothetical protein
MMILVQDRQMRFDDGRGHFIGLQVRANVSWCFKQIGTICPGRLSSRLNKPLETIEYPIGSLVACQSPQDARVSS